MSKNLTIPNACDIAGISKAMMYKLWRVGLGPKITKIGRRTFVSTINLQDWLNSLEQKTQAGVN